MPPLVSIVIPAYNAARFLSATLESVVTQSHAPVEIIVVDDGSTDGTRACVERFGERVRYVRQANSGGCSAPRNAGARLARGELLAFFDADDLMLPGRVGRQAAALSAHPGAALVFSNYRNFCEGSFAPTDHFATCPRLRRLLAAMAQPDRVVLEPDCSTGLLLTENFGASPVMVRARVFAEVGGYDERLKACEDYDFQYRVAARHPVVLLQQVDWHRRLHAAGMCGNTGNMLHHNIIAREGILARESSRERRRVLRGVIAGYHQSLAYHYTGRDNRQALRHAWTAARLRRRPGARHFARIVLDALGRNTHAAAAPARLALARGSR